MTTRSWLLVLIMAFAPQAQAASLSFSTTFSIPVLVTEVPECFSLFVPPRVIQPLETGVLRVSLDASQLVPAAAPDGVTARFVLPTRLEQFIGFQDLTADFVFELTTPSASASAGPDFIGFPTDVAATFDFVDGPVRQLRIGSFDFSGGLQLMAFDPAGTALPFDLSDREQLFAAFPSQLEGLVGTFRVFDQAGEALSGLLLPRPIPSSQPVPEPAGATLFLAGALALVWKLRRSHKRAVLSGISSSR